MLRRIGDLQVHSRIHIELDWLTARWSKAARGGLLTAHCAQTQFKICETYRGGRVTVQARTICSVMGRGGGEKWSWNCTSFLSLSSPANIGRATTFLWTVLFFLSSFLCWSTADKTNSTFLGPNGTRCARCLLRAQKSLDFQGPPLQTALVMDFPASNSIRPAPYKQHVH